MTRASIALCTALALSGCAATDYLPAFLVSPPPAVAVTSESSPAAVLSDAPTPAALWPVDQPTLRAALNAWGPMAGYKIVWAATSDGHPIDWPITVTGAVTGDFSSAVAQLLDGFITAPLRPIGVFHANAVLEIRAE